MAEIVQSLPSNPPTRRQLWGSGETHARLVIESEESTSAAGIVQPTLPGMEREQIAPVVPNAGK